MQNFLNTSSFIANSWVQGNTTETLEIKDKYFQNTLSEISLLSDSQVDFAIEQASIAFEEMKKWDQGKRSDHLFKLALLLEENKEAFASLICAEAGKPISYAKAEVERSIFTLKVSAEEARRICGEVIPLNFNHGSGLEGYTKRFPVGVIACISPFNFPLNLALHKIGPALAAGNTVVLKPSPYAPLTVLALASLAKKAGFLSGALNIVVCDNDVASKLITDERVKMISFTGSPAIGWMLKERAKKKKITLELGGNASVIVDHSADIEDACKKIVHGAFLYSGQICISTQRVYVDSSIYDEFVESLLELAEEVVCGNPNETGTIVGPVIDEVHLNRIHTWVKEAVNGGAQVLCGGHILDEEHNIYAPTILTDTTPDMKVVKEEIFGPVVIVERTDYFDEAIELVNDSKFGLQAGLFTNQLDQMKYAFNKIEVGGLIMNNVPGFRIDSMPYGGIKDSGLGREGVRYAIEDMTEPRLLVF